MKNQVIIDYLAFTIKNDNENELVGSAREFHTFLENFCSTYGHPLENYTGGHLYTKGYMSFSGFRTYFGGSQTGRTMFVQISGSGCVLIDRYFEGGLLNFMQYLLQFCPKIKRLDLAADEVGEASEDSSYCLNIDRLIKYKEKHLLTGSARKVGIHSDENLRGKRLSGFTMYLGSRKSDVFMRIYDKLSEQNIHGDGHWMRCELELHNSKATEAFIILTSADDFELRLKEFYNSVCLNHIRFIDKIESNITRSKTSKWWTDFLDGCEVKFKFSQERELKTIHNLMNWVDHSVLGAIKVVQETYGLSYLLKLLDKFVSDGRLSPAHQRMILEFNQEEQRIFDEYHSNSPGVSSGAEPPQQQSFNIEVL